MKERERKNYAILHRRVFTQLRNEIIEKRQEIQRLKTEAEKEGIFLKTTVESPRKATAQKDKEIKQLKNDAEQERIMLHATVESLRKEKDEKIKKLELGTKDAETKCNKLLLDYTHIQSDIRKIKKVTKRNCKRYQQSTTFSDIKTLKRDLEFEKNKEERNKRAHHYSRRRIKTITDTIKCLEDQTEEYEISPSPDSSSLDEYLVFPDESNNSRHMVKGEKNSGSESASKSVVNVTHVTAQKVNFINHSNVELESAPAPDMDERLLAIED